MTVKRWHLITGEYPPQPGGISDYTGLLAGALADEGIEVHVWTSPSEGIESCNTRVVVHRVAGAWTAKDFAHLDVKLNAFGEPCRLLVQYTPNAWGRKGLNFRFCRWVAGRRKTGDDVRLMVHEPFYPWHLWDKPTRWLLAAGQRWMIKTLLAASSQVYLSIPGWENYLRAYETGNPLRMSWLPIFSTIPVVNDAERVAALRRCLAPEGQTVIGSFGTFGGAIGKTLSQILPSLLRADPGRIGLLLGRDGDAFAERLRASHPQLSGRLIAPGQLPAELVSLHLQACDLLVQPYPDGVSSRRTSAMAGLAHGIPIVTTKGFLSEPTWSQTNCAALIPSLDVFKFVQAADSLLNDTMTRINLGRHALNTYDQLFALKRTVETLLCT